MKNKRLLALDFGSKTVGVAITDELHVTISLFPVIRRESLQSLEKHLQKLKRYCQLMKLRK